LARPSAAIRMMEAERFEPAVGLGSAAYGASR
jgi:hypothetical protein